MEGGRGCKLWSQEHKSFLQQITSWPSLLNSPPTLLYLQLHKYFTINKISRWVWNWYVILSWMVRSLRLPQSDPPPLWKIMVTTLLIVARWAGLIRKGRVQLKTGLKLWENILQTVRRIDFQIIEVKGIAVIFIYIKASSLNFQLLVEVVIKKAMGIFAWQAPISFFFGLFIFYDSLFLSEYLVMGTRLSSLGVAIKYLWCSLR